ncbi:N-acetylglucosamine-6-phosphate deacetylase [Luedemannella flava]|uniref:N-acetylglucosamine-6-phosphate deacetylase n=1 Tax=Luedemannella flava TaxID=349316 RepID=A0ABN2LRT1_9ACTN
MKVRGSVVTPTGIVSDGTVEIADGRIVEVVENDPSGRLPEPGAPGADISAAWVLPGFVDIHVHGGGGASFTTGDPDEAARAIAFHLAHGTTTMLASLVTAPTHVLRDATVAFAPLIASGALAGIHYEGPYLSAARCGAQNPAHLRDPDLDELSALLDLGGVRMVTIAPELPRALDAIRLLVERGVVAAVGHTDATYEQTLAAVGAGASVGTHVCNGMRPIHHREPGPIVALLRAAGVVCEQVPDGIHLHDGMLGFAAQMAGAARVALITDAMAAAGMPDGAYELGGLSVRVAGGVARLATNDAIAGSTLTMDAAFRHTVHSGVSIVDAAVMAATTPAGVLGLTDDIGLIAPGRRADLVLMDEELQVTGVLRAGAPVLSGV